MIKRTFLILASLSVIVFGVLYAIGVIPPDIASRVTDKAFAMIEHKIETSKTTSESTKPKTKSDNIARAPAISVARVSKSQFVERILVTGTLVAREKVLVTPEVEGLRVTSFEAEEGDTVTKGQILAHLEDTTLKTSLEQNTAAIARADAAVEQAESQINEAEAVLKESSASLQRARPLEKSRYLSQSTLDQREAAASTAKARLQSARSGETLAKADKQSLLAQRREVEWRLSRSAIKSPVSGLISKRNVRIGEMASGTREPMFEIILNSEIELDAEVDAVNLVKVKQGQPAIVEASGVEPVKGSIRLVSPQVDQATRLGHVRVLLGANPSLKVGAYARGTIETAHSSNLSIPATAVLYGPEGATVLRVENNIVRSTPIRTGLQSNGKVEVLEGLSAGDMVVAKAGTFLRDGDQIRPVEKGPELSKTVSQSETTQ